MIKLVIFDLDGVLLDAKDMHFITLNKALQKIAGDKFIISYDDHTLKYDGLPTLKKLLKLNHEKGLNPALFPAIGGEKQKHTIEYLKKEVAPQYHLSYICRSLIANGIKICVASNSVRATVRQALISLGIIEYVDFYYSNEDVINPKPHSEMYLKCMMDCKVNPAETLIVEDSTVGRLAVANSGAHLHAVSNPEDLNLNSLMEAIFKIESKKETAKWQGKNMNVLIPMAGAGSRFKEAGYTFPKPLINVNGKPMIQVVVENLNIDANYIYIVQKEHYEKYNLEYMLNLITPNCKIVQVDGLTEGAACTALLAKEYIDNSNELVIANSDQYVDWNSNDFLYMCTNPEIDGAILTFPSVHPKWSFVKTGDNGLVTEVAEKKPISNEATVGIYYFKQGRYFVEYAEKMIARNKRVNNEFYICPVFNELIADEGRIKTMKLEENSMWGLGTPEDLKTFLDSRPI